MEFYDAEKISKKGLEILSKFNTASSLAWLMNNVSFNLLGGKKETSIIDGGIRFASDTHKYEALYLDGKKPLVSSIAVSGIFRLYCDDRLVVQTDYNSKSECVATSEIFWNWHSVAILRLSSWVEDIPSLVDVLKTDKDNELTAHAEKKMMRGKIFERSFELGMYDKIL